MAILLGRGSPVRRSLYALFAVVLLFGAVFAASAAASYDLRVSNSIDGPEQEFTVEGETYRVSSMSYYASGEPIEASVTRSGDGSDYEVLLYNTDRKIEKDTRPLSGDEDVTFQTDDLSVGTYLLAVDDNDGFQALHPVVIQGYQVDLDGQSTVATGESWTATATLDAYADAPAVHSVEFVLLGEDTEERFEASETGSGTYEATVTAPEDAGEYSFGVIVRGTNEVEDGEREPVAVSDSMTLDVQSGGSDGDGGEGGDGADGGEGGEGTATTTPTEGTDAATPDGDPETGIETESDQRSTDEEPETPGSDGPVTPVEPNGTTGADDPVSEESGVDDQPGFGAGAALAALLAALTLLARRR